MQWTRWQRIRTASGGVAVALLLGVSAGPAGAGTYYVANDGDDANAGTGINAPLRSLARAQQLAGGGDTVLLRRGDVFRESAQFGGNTSIGAYGQTNLPRPSIRGSDVVNGWSQHDGDIYVADFTGDAGYVFVNQQQATLARFPNEGWLRTTNWTETSQGYDTVVTSNGLTGHSRNGNDYWNGANIRWHRHSWWFETRTVTDYSANGQLSLDEKSIIPIQPWNKNGWGFYLDNKLEELDAPGEYYHNRDAGKLYLMAPDGADPNDLTVEVAVRDRGIQLSSGAVRDIEFAHQKDNGLRIGGQTTVENAHFEGIGSDAGGAALSGSWGAGGSLIRGNSFENNLNVAINWNQNPGDSRQTVIERNELHQSGTVDGYGGEGPWHAAGIIISNGQSIRIQHNRIDGTGYAGIIVGDDGNFVEYNVIDDAMHTLNDGAGIYVNASETTIRHNIIREVRGGMESSGPWANLAHGIWPEFLNNYHDQLIENNTVINAGGYSIYFDNNYDSIVRGNVLWGSDRSQIDLSGRDDPDQRHLITANVFVATEDGEALVRFRHNMDYGETDGNYYVDLADEPTVVPFDKGWAPWSAISLEQWQQQYGAWADGEPIVWSPEMMTDGLAELFVNETDEAMTLDLPVPFMDLDGNVIGRQVELGPYSSQVLIPLPEPGASTLLLLGAAALLRRRRADER